MGAPHGPTARRLDRQLALTRAALWVEQIARAFWPVFTLLCLFLALALFGAFAPLGPVSHRILLGAFIFGLAGTLILGGARFRRPDGQAARDRLDRSDPARPLSVLSDELAIGLGHHGAESAWRLHRARASAAAARLTAGWPGLQLEKRDAWALRLFAPLLLIAGLIGAGSDWAARIAMTASPLPMAPPTGAQTATARVEAWATPPAHTGLATVYLTRENRHEQGDHVIELPENSEITIRVTDAGPDPKITGAEIAGIESFANDGGGLAEARGVLAQSGEISISGRDGELANWAIEMIPDHAPEIALANTPHAALSGALEFDFTAQDDYGVTAAWAKLAPEGHDPDSARGLPLPAISFGLPLPLSGDRREIADRAIHDLTAHPWAGSEVLMRLYAEDGAGQITASEPIRVTIPARHFSDRLAAALVEQRRNLALDYAESARVLDVSQAVTRRPEELFDNPGIFLTVRSAIRRLAHGIGSDDVPGAAPEVTGLFWEAALALEDGNLSSALEQLRMAQQLLREALESGTDEDIARAMDELRAALDQYLENLAQNQRDQTDPNAPPGDPDRTLSRQDLQDMLDRMQAQAESGMRDQARDMLSDLQHLLENLQAGAGEDQQGQGRSAMQQLQEMIQGQRDLSDRTFDELRQRRRQQQFGEGGQDPGADQPGPGEGGPPGSEGQSGNNGAPGDGRNGTANGRPDGGAGGLAGEQEALCQQLDALARGLGQGNDAARRALEEAGRAMGEARDNIESGADSDAVHRQMEALERLNEGADALAESEQGEGSGQAQGSDTGEGRTASDPFGRPGSGQGAMDGGSTRVPDQALADRARELMHELRRRSADPSRPKLELDYFERLLERF